MKVLISGASGLIGSALVAALGAGGHQVTRLVRSASSTAPDTASWDPAGGHIDRNGIEGHDATVHLAGESIAGRWTPARKARIRASRVEGTRLLATELAGLRRPPATLASASAVGYYGHRGDETLTEDSPPGRGFLPDLAQEWEAATRPAADAGIRVAHLRFAVVLSRDGGALKKMLLPFRLGLGGPLGHGRQHMSWVAIDDVVGAILHVLATPALRGPVNVGAPGAVANREFTRVLARVLRRPAILPAPAPALRLMFGDMADEALLASARMAPRRLLETGYTFRFPALEPALRHVLDRP